MLDLLQMIISPVTLLLPETGAHLINADAADSDDELASDLMADVPEHLLAQTMPRLLQPQMMYMHNNEDTPTNILGQGGFQATGKPPWVRA